jgi:hypothetical protein
MHFRHRFIVTRWTKALVEDQEKTSTARQRYGEHISEVTSNQEVTEELLNAVIPLVDCQSIVM